MATETTITSPTAWSPDLQAIAPADAVPAALILSTSTVAGNIEGDAPAVRAMYVDDAAATFVAEGAVIPEADPDLAEALVYTGKVSQLIRLSREQWLQPNAQTLLADSVRRAVTRAGDLAYLAQVAPTAPAVTPPAGLLNVAGITPGGEVAANLDGLIDLLATLAGAGGNPTDIVVDPVAWASMRKLKTATGSAQTLLGAGVTDALPMLLGLPVRVTNALPAGTGMVLDKNAVVSAVGPVQVATSADAYFASDSIGLRCTWRFGATVVHPDRVGTFTVAA